MIRCRCHLIILTILIALCLSIQLSEVTVSAQAPPYPPLALSYFKIVRTAWVSTNQTVYAAPGDTNIPLYVTVQNIGNRTATGLSYTLFLQQPFTNITGGQYVDAFYEGSVSPGLTATTKFILNIARNASIGVHILKMRINYLQVVSGVGTTLYLKQQADVEFPVFVTGATYMAVYSMNIFPREVPPGGNITISGTVVNTATSTLSNTNISVSSQAFSRGAFIYVGQTDPNIPRPFSLAFQVRRDLSEGTYPIELLVTYSDSFSVNHVNSVTSIVRVVPRVITPAEIIPAKGPLDILIDILWRLFRFFFGSSARAIIECLN